MKFGVEKEAIINFNGTTFPGREVGGKREKLRENKGERGEEMTGETKLEIRNAHKTVGN